MKSISDIKFLTFLTKRYSRLGMGGWFFLYRRGYLFTLFLTNAIMSWDLSVCPRYNEPIGYLPLFLSSVSTSYIPTFICIHTFIHHYTHAFIHLYIHTSLHSNIPTIIHSCIYTFIHPYIYISLKSYIYTSKHSYIYISLHLYAHTSYIPTSAHPYTFICTHTFIFIHSYIRTFIHLCFYI